MTWLTAREIAGLPGMPTSERRTRDRLSALAIPSRPRAGRTGGGGLEYDCSALPEETRAAITANTIQAAGSKALAVVDIRFYKRNETTGAYDAINLDLAAV